MSRSKDLLGKISFTFFKINLKNLILISNKVYHPNIGSADDGVLSLMIHKICTRVGTLIVATNYLQLIQNRYMFRSFTVLHCSHQHCVQPVASDVEVVGYL